MILKYLLKKLHEEFNTENIYSEDVPQGVNLPAFFVRIVNTSLDPQLGNLYLLRTMFSITYLEKENKPERLTDDDLYHLEDIRMKMIWAVKQIDRDNFGLEARNVETRINDNSIVLTCNYDLLIEEKEVGDTMQDLDIVIKPKEIDYMREFERRIKNG